MSTRLLLIEDDEDLARGLCFNLELDGYEVRRVRTLAEARDAWPRGAFSLAILDLSLPDGNGLDLLAEFRAHSVPLPTICLTARGTEADIVMGLKLGADDYLPKPFGLAQLLARIEAVLRRVNPTESAARGQIRKSEPATDLRLGSVLVDLAAHVAIKGTERVELTPIEVEILKYLAARRGTAIERRDLLRDLWGLDRYVTTRTLDNHVARLRKKVEVDPAWPRHLITVHGVGYRLDLS